MREKSKKIKSLIGQGDALLANRDLDAAELYYRKALALDNNSAEALYSIGCVYSHRKDFKAALDWAQRSLRSDPGYRPAYLLMGNMLRGLNKHEESLEAFKAVPGAQSDKRIQAEMGLCCEYLGRWEEAEKHLRAALEMDPSYVTRFNVLAWYEYDPFIADIHHALARVLQRQNKIEESRLHYYLAKRIDATTQLNPMYLDIMSESDLENHPAEDNSLDVKEPSIDDECEAKLKYILQLTDVDDIKKAVRLYKSDDIIDLVVFAIKKTQIESKFYLSAWLRAIGDLFIDAESTDLLLSLETPSWKRILELAEDVNLKKISQDDAFDLIDDIEFDWKKSELLINLTMRFLDLELATGLTIALIADRKLSRSINRNDIASSGIILGIAYYRSQMFERADSEFRKALAIYKEENEIEGELLALNYLDQVYSYQNKLNKALLVIDQYIQLSSSHEKLEHVLQGRYRKALVLFENKQTQECYNECLDISRMVKEMDITGAGEYFDALKKMLMAAANSLGCEVPMDLLDYLETKADLKADNESESINSLLVQAEEMREKGELKQALETLKLARRNAEEGASQETVFQVLSSLGYLLYETGNFDEASEALNEALELGEYRTLDMDIWPVLICLGNLAEKNSEYEKAQEHYESALKEARLKRDNDREIESLLKLSEAVKRYDENLSNKYINDCFIKISSGFSNVDGPQNLREGIAAVQEGRFADAIELLEDFCNHERPDDENIYLEALENMCIAYLQLGDADEAIDRWKRASGLWLKREEPDKAIGMLFGIVTALMHEGKDGRLLLYEMAASLFQEGGDGRKYFDKIFGSWQKIEDNSIRFKAGLRLAMSFIEFGELSLAERALIESLQFCKLGESDNLVYELAARNYLGQIYRQTGRYNEALEQYKSALAIAQYGKDELEEGMIRGNMAIALRYIGRLSSAVEEYNRAIEIADNYGESEMAARNRMNIAKTFFLLGYKDKGLDNALTALDYYDSSNNEEMSSHILAFIEAENINDLPPEIESRIRELDKTGSRSRDGFVRDQSQLKKVRKLVGKGKIERAKSIMQHMILNYHEKGDLFNEAMALYEFAIIPSGKDKEQSMDYANKALEISQFIGEYQLTADIRRFLLDHYLAIKDDDQIISNLHALFNIWRKMLRNLTTDRDKINFANDIAEIIEFYISNFMELGKYDLAFELLEWGRSQPLADMIISDLIKNKMSEKPAAKVLLEKEAEIIAQINNRADPSGKINRKLPTDCGEKKIEKEEALEAIYDKLMTYDPIYVLQKRGLPVDLPRAQKLISTFNQPVILLTFDIMDGEVIIMSLRSDEKSLSLHRTNITQLQVQELLDLSIEDFKDKQGARLWFDSSAKFLSGIADRIQKDDLVIIVSSGDIQQLPLHAIRFPSGEFLIERAEVIYSPSLTVLEALQISYKYGNKSTIELKTVGVNFRDEALALMQWSGFAGPCLTGNNISKDKLKDFISDCKMVHFSCHGQFDPKHYLNSGLVLSDSPPDTLLLKDILSLRDLMDWRLDKDLVVLSACETGLGKSEPSEFLGLSRGFLGAGVKALIVTLWSIEDTSTMDFMLKFYGELHRQIEAKGTSDFASALRRTQCEFIQRGDASFYDWAAFKLIGKPLVDSRKVKHVSGRKKATRFNRIGAV